MSRKPQSNAVLKTMTEDRQAEIFSRLTVKTDAWPDTSLEAVRKWLADDGIKTSTRALSVFHSWYSLSRRLARNASVAERLKEEIKAGNPGITPEELDFIGQKFFTELAIDEGDSLAWQRAQNVKIKQGALALESRRISLLEKKAAAFDKATGILKNKELTEDQKRQRMLELFGVGA